jgi:hypothetical protein
MARGRPLFASHSLVRLSLYAAVRAVTALQQGEGEGEACAQSVFGEGVELAAATRLTFPSCNPTKIPVSQPSNMACTPLCLPAWLAGLAARVAGVVVVAAAVRLPC